jgi:hypothetical protein
MKTKSLLLGLTVVLALAVFLLLLPTSTLATETQYPETGIQNHADPPLPREGTGSQASILPALAARPGGEAKGQNSSLGSDLLLSVHPYDDYDPAVAYNPPAGEFLVVWRNGSRIAGQRYLASGQPLGELFYVGEQVATQAYPAVAYSQSADRYLVVWEDNRSGYYDIYGQLVDADGTLIDDNFFVYQGNGNQQRPDVASDGTNFLVVWHGNYQDDSTEVVGRLVADYGEPGPVIEIAVDGGTTRHYPAVAYNAWADEYLVVLEYGTPSGAIHARRVGADGSLPGAEYTVNSQPVAEFPDLAAGPWGATGGYVVVWDDSRDGDPNIYSRVVLAGSDNAFDGNSFSIDSSPGEQYQAAIARAPVSGRYLVAWTDTRTQDTSDEDIYARHLTDDANLAGPSFAVSDVADWQAEVAVAAGDAPDAYFVAWLDDRLGAADIQGQRIAANGSLLWYQFTISALPGVHVAPAVAYSWPDEHYLAVWEGDHDGHKAIYGQRLSSDGEPLEEPWAIEADGHDNIRPAVAYGEDQGQFVVVWRDEELDKLEGRQVLPDGTATVLFSVTSSDGGQRPRIAYDTVSDRFLVVWDDGDDVLARALDGYGFPMGGPTTTVAGGAGHQLCPDLTFGLDSELFLVAWYEDLSGVNRLYGQMVDESAQLIGFNFPIAGGDGIARQYPSVAYKPASRLAAGEYLVVYEYDSDVGTKIYGRRMNTTGGTIGTEFLIRDDPDMMGRFGPQVIYSPGGGLYFVLWVDNQGGETGYDLYGQWLDYLGNPAGNVLPFFRYYGYTGMPRLAYDPIHEQGLVVWTDARRGEWGNVYARLGALDTSPPTALFTRDPTAGRVGDAFTLNAWPSFDDLTPSGALAVRWDLNGDGSWDTTWDLDKSITITPGTQGTYNVTLEVRDLMWLTDTLTLPVIVLPAGGNTPPQAYLTVLPLWAQAGTQFELNATGCSDAETPSDDLVVRWDWENDGQWDTDWSAAKVIFHTYTDAGPHVVRVEVRDGGSLTDAAVDSFLLLPNTPIMLEVDPHSAKTFPGLTIQFAAAAQDGFGNWMYNPPVTWSLADPQAGTIDAGGLFTAGNYTGEYNDVVIATWGQLTATANVLIYYPYHFHLPLVLKNH